MTSSTRIISKDDLSKSGKMKVMSREVDGELQHGKHKVTTIPKTLLLTASRILDSNTLITTFIVVNSGETSVESWKIFVSEVNGLIDTSSDIENAFDGITTGLDISVYKSGIGVINAPFPGYHIDGISEHGTPIESIETYYMYIIQTIDGQKKFSVITIPANSGTTQLYAYDEDSINLP